MEARTKGGEREGNLGVEDGVGRRAGTTLWREEMQKEASWLCQ